MPSPDAALVPEADQSMHAQSLLPGGASVRPLVDFFSRAITSFQHSKSAFHVICTLAPGASPGASGDWESPLLVPVPPRSRPHTLIVLDSSFNPPTRAHLRMATSAIDDKARTMEQGSDSLRLLLLLAINNADKAPKPAAFEQRLAMMWAFAKDVQKHVIGERRGATASEDTTQPMKEPSIDIALSTQPYFHEKSAAIAAADFYKAGSNEGEMEQIILIGYDTLIRIFNPKYYGPPAAEAEQLPSSIIGPGETPMQRALSPFFARAKLRATLRSDDEWGTSADQQNYLDDLLHGDGLSRIGGSKDWGSRIELVEGRKKGEDIVSSTYARAAAKSRDWGTLDRMVTLEVRSWIEKEGLYAQ